MWIKLSIGVIQCAGLFRAAGAIGDLYSMVSQVCVPTRERGNEELATYLL